MKRFVDILACLYKPIIIKIILILIFINNTGIVPNLIEGLKNIPKLTVEERNGLEQRAAEYRHFCDKIIGRAYNKKFSYSYENYFEDLISIYEASNRLNVPMEFRYLGSLDGFAGNQFIDNIERLKALEQAREIYGETADQIAGLNTKPHKNGKGLKELLNWALTLYFHSWFCALIWFLIVIYEEQRRKGEKFRISNPIGFMLALIFYPVVFGYWIWWTLKYAYAEAEYRRTKKNLLSVISDNEIERIKAISKKLPLKDIRAHFTGHNRIYLHSLAATLAVTVMFMIIPKPIQAKTAGYFPGNCKLFQQQLPRSNIDDNISAPDEATLIRFRYEKIPPPCLKYILIWIKFCFQEVFIQINHIPIYRLANRQSR